MAIVYILFSASANAYYVGSCEDLQLRLNDHNSGKYPGSYTRKATDWEVYLSIPDLSYSQARNIEQHIKRMKSRVYLENLLKFPEIISRLKDTYR